MSSTRRHSIRRLELRNAQVLLRQRDCWLRLRQSITGLRTRELKNVIALGRQTDKDICLSLAIDRMYQVRESSPIFDVKESAERSAMQSVAIELTSDALQREIVEKETSSAFPVADSPPVTPPGVKNVRQTPRRPGAPSTAPALVNHFQINAGARVAPEIELS